MADHMTQEEAAYWKSLEEREAYSAARYRALPPEERARRVALSDERIAKETWPTVICPADHPAHSLWEKDVRVAKWVAAMMAQPRMDEATLTEWLTYAMDTAYRQGGDDYYG